MSSLYDINAKLLDLVDENGEISDEEALEGLLMEREEKITNIALWVLNLRSDVEQYQAEIKRFQEKVSKANKKIESLSAYLQNNLGGNNWEDANKRVTCKYSYSEETKVDDITKIPPEYLRVKTVTDADKVAIKNAIKSGEVIEGAHIQTNCNFKIK